MVRLSDSEYQARLDREKQLVEQVESLRYDASLARTGELMAMRALMAIGHKLSIENAEQFHSAEYAEKKIIDKIAELKIDLRAAYSSAREVEVILERAKKATEVPAAEHVPALSDAWDLIDKAIRRLP